MARTPASVLLLLLSLTTSIATGIGGMASAHDGPTATAACGGSVLLSDGVSVQGSLAAGESCLFVFPRVAGKTHARIELASAGADLDLYVMIPNTPTLTQWHCRPYLRGAATETCTVYNDLGSSIMVTPYAGGGTFTITATSLDLPTCATTGIVPLSNGTAVTAEPLSSWGDRCFFSFEPSNEFDMLKFIVPGAPGSGLALFVKRGALPTRQTYDCLIDAVYAAPSCGFANQGGIYYAMVIRTAGSAASTITAHHASNCPLGWGAIPIPKGGSISGVLPSNVGGCLFAFQSDASADIATFTVSGSSFVPLQARAGAPPNGTSWDCRLGSTTISVDTCKVASDGGVVYARVLPNFAPMSFTIAADDAILPTLLPGLPVMGEAPDRTETLYKMVVPEGAGHASVALAEDPRALRCYTSSPCLSRVDLYVSARKVPSIMGGDCSPNGAQVRSCVFGSHPDDAIGPVTDPTDRVRARPFPGPGKYFVLARTMLGENDLVEDGRLAWIVTAGSA